MRRTWLVYAVLTLVIGLLALAVAFTRFPEAELFVRAEELPRIGPRLAEVRRLYLPPEELPGTQPNGETAGAESPGPATSETFSGPPGSAPLNPPAGSPGVLAGQSHWLAPDEVLRSRPSPDAPELGRVDAFTAVPVLDRRGRWLRVRFQGREGWVLPPERAPGEPPLGSDPSPTLPLPSRPPDPQRLARALDRLGSGARAIELGPYAAHTDVEDAGLLAFLGRVAAAVEPAYRARYRQPPVGDAREAVVLLAREADYRALQESEERLRQLPSGGHAGYGLVALWVGDRGRDEVASTLAHELVHMLNRRALGPALPPWLNEGLATDLGSSAITASGAIDPSRLGGVVMRTGDRITYSGARAAIRQVMEAREEGDLPRLKRLLSLDWDEFVRSDRRQLHYPLAAFWVRYLLEGEDGALAGDFRRFLALVAAGRPATGEALVDVLGRSWDSLGWGFDRWLEELAVREADYDPTVAPGSSDSSSRQTSSPDA